MYTLMVADDHPLFRDAIVGVLRDGMPDSRVMEADSLVSTLSLADEHDDLDLILLDLGLPDAEGLAGLKRLRDYAPLIPVAIVSADQDRATVLEAINLGAVGYIPKSTPRGRLLDALHQVLEGNVYLPPDIMRRPTSTMACSTVPEQETAGANLALLTGKQREVLAQMALGDSNKMIAYRLAIAETTVKTHVSAILRKLGVSSRVQAILVANEAGIGHQSERP
ncbi:response regulator [Aidingimonas halophila]|uniref:Two component transcriptional regulator, LuxR family n=1 Tax=Aidingimonas halophila TaxID=574349 RepID=A0A1H2SGB1_9GAMM|nr:response regulator transcription factor [Aidingimonas halophila]GHC17675.1 glycerol metabolism activator [Aidingimonas halophila]SDW30661.1 two component transcriptional regulator, LuxR family [Aidingimonas halophila]